MKNYQKRHTLDELLEYYQAPVIPTHLVRSLENRARSSAAGVGARQQPKRLSALMWIPAAAVAAAIVGMVLLTESTPKPPSSPAQKPQAQVEEHSQTPLRVICVDSRTQAECRRRAAHQGLVINGDLSSVPKYEFLMAREFVRELSKRR